MMMAICEFIGSFSIILIIIFQIDSTFGNENLILLQDCSYNEENLVIFENNKSESSINIGLTSKNASENFIKYEFTIKEILIPQYLSSSGIKLNFGLKTTSLKCSTHYEEFIVVINNKNSLLKISEDGYLINDTQSFKPENYCINRNNEEIHSFKICKSKCADPDVICIPKCCRVNELYNFEKNICETSKCSKWMTSIYRNDNFTSIISNSLNKKEILYESKLSSCKPLFSAKTTGQNYIEGDNKLNEIRLLQNGTLLIKEHSDWEDYGAPFCLDGVVGSSEIVLVDLKDCSNWEHSKAFEINYDENYMYNILGTINNIHSILMMLCAVFLFCSLIIYILLWKKQNIHGWTVMAYMTSLMFLYIHLFLFKMRLLDDGVSFHYNGVETCTEFSDESNNLTDNNVNHEDVNYLELKSGLACKLNGIFAHFSFIASMTWLTVVNFDIWQKFRNMNPHPNQSKEIIRFFLYAICAYGVPLIIVLIGLLLQSESSSAIRPNYGKNHSCFLQPDALGVYIYYPIGVLLCLNLAFFVSTAYQINLHFNMTKQIHDDKKEQEYESCKVIIKLFVVMGITWILELASFLFNTKSSVPETIIWSIVDCVNILQAVGIFFIFIWKRQILMQLCQLYPSAKPYIIHLKKLPGCKQNTYSQGSHKMTNLKSIRSHGSGKSKSENTRKLSTTTSIDSTFDNVEI